VRRRLALASAAVLFAGVALGACSSEPKKQTPATTTTETTISRDGGAGRAGANGGAGNEGGRSKGPKPSASNSGGG